MQPKREIVSFLASKGIRTATFYDSPEIAMAKKAPNLMLRSEHPQDYEGSSDLFPKCFLEGTDLNGKDVAGLVLSQDTNYMDVATERIRLHCRLLGLNYDDFIKDLSYSAWERIEGTNRVVCADSAINERYHIFTLSNNSKGAYDVVEKSEVQQMTDTPPIELKEAKGLIRLYEEARAVLDPNHCYILETQSVRNMSSRTFDHFVVQAHRGTDSRKVDFEAKPHEWGLIKFYDVRGATSPEGEEMLLTFEYPDRFADEPEIIREDASAQVSEHYVARAFSELMFRKRRLQIFPFSQNAGLEYELNNHCSRNALLKPQCSVLTNYQTIRDGFPDLLSRKDKNGFIQVKVKFWSDGRKAFMQPLD